MLKRMMESSVTAPTTADAGSSGLPFVLPKNSGKAVGIMAIPSRKRTTPVTSSGNIRRKKRVKRLTSISRSPERISMPDRSGMPPAPAARTDAGR